MAQLITWVLLTSYDISKLFRRLERDAQVPRPRLHVVPDLQREEAREGQCGRKKPNWFCDS